MHQFGGKSLLAFALLVMPGAAYAKKKDPAPPPPGSAVRESANEELLETATGDAFTRLDDAKPARFRLTGPAASPSAPAPVVSPPPTPRSDPERLAVEAGAVGYVRWAAKRFDPVAPGISVSVLRPIGARGPGDLAVGASTGWRHHTGGRTFEEYRGRVLAPYVADVDAVPIEIIARGTRPMGGTAVLVQAGLGLEYARSSFAKTDDLPRRWRENDWAPTASLAAGAERSLGGGMLGVRVGGRLARHAFTAHDFEILHGVESTLSWRRSF